MPMGPDELQQLLGTLERFAEARLLRSGGQIVLEGEMRTHVGLGSATAIRLASLEALAIVNGSSVDRAAIVRASGRGGTSGIGVNSYFDGGLVCDLGRACGGDFLPSSRADASSPQLALPSVAMPDWPILLCLPRDIPGKTQPEEIEFFERTAPLSAESSYEASYIAMFELYAAAVDSDFAAFCRGVERMQSTAWKRAERAQYGTRLAAISDGLRRGGARCVGMSSLGPLLFCLADRTDMANLAQIAASFNCDTFEVRPTNSGRRLSVCYA